MIRARSIAALGLVACAAVAACGPMHWPGRVGGVEGEPVDLPRRDPPQRPAPRPDTPAPERPKPDRPDAPERRPAREPEERQPERPVVPVNSARLTIERDAVLRTDGLIELRVRLEGAPLVAHGGWYRMAVLSASEPNELVTLRSDGAGRESPLEAAPVGEASASIPPPPTLWLRTSTFLRCDGLLWLRPERRPEPGAYTLEFVERRVVVPGEGVVETPRRVTVEVREQR